MVEAKLLYKILGSLLITLGLLMGGCALMAGCYQEDDIMAFLISSLFTGCCGFIFKYLGRNATNDMSRRTAYLVVTLSWLLYSLFGMLPYIIGGYINSVTDAYFETMSWLQKDRRLPKSQ